MENLPGGLTELQNISMSSLKGEAGCGDSDSAASSSGVLSAISRIKTSGSTSASNTPGRALGVLVFPHNGCGVVVEVLVTLWMFFSCWKWYISGKVWFAKASKSVRMLATSLRTQPPCTLAMWRMVSLGFKLALSKD